MHVWETKVAFTLLKPAVVTPVVKSCLGETKSRTEAFPSMELCRPRTELKNFMSKKKPQIQGFPPGLWAARGKDTELLTEH